MKTIIFISILLLIIGNHIISGSEKKSIRKVESAGKPNKNPSKSSTKVNPTQKSTVPKEPIVKHQPKETKPPQKDQAPVSKSKKHSNPPLPKSDQGKVKKELDASKKQPIKSPSRETDKEQLKKQNKPKEAVKITKATLSKTSDESTKISPSKKSAGKPQLKEQNKPQLKEQNKPSVKEKNKPPKKKQIKESSKKKEPDDVSQIKQPSKIKSKSKETAQNKPAENTKCPDKTKTIGECIEDFRQETTFTYTLVNGKCVASETTQQVQCICPETSTIVGECDGIHVPVKVLTYNVSEHNTCKREVYGLIRNCSIECAQKLDILLYLGTMDSVSSKQWNEIQRFLFGLFQEFTFAKNATHLTVMQYTPEDKDATNSFSYSSHHDHQSLFKSIKETPFQIGSNDLAAVINAVKFHASESSYGRKKSVSQIVYLLIDAVDTFSPEIVEQVAELHQLGLHLVFILVDSKSDQVMTSDMAYLADLILVKEVRELKAVITKAAAARCESEGATRESVYKDITKKLSKLKEDYSKVKLQGIGLTHLPEEMMGKIYFQIEGSLKKIVGLDAIDQAHFLNKLVIIMAHKLHIPTYAFLDANLTSQGINGDEKVFGVSFLLLDAYFPPLLELFRAKILKFLDEDNNVVTLGSSVTYISPTGRHLLSSLEHVIMETTNIVMATQRTLQLAHHLAGIKELDRFLLELKMEHQQIEEVEVWKGGNEVFLASQSTLKKAMELSKVALGYSSVAQRFVVGERKPPGSKGKTDGKSSVFVEVKEVGLKLAAHSKNLLKYEQGTSELLSLFEKELKAGHWSSSQSILQSTFDAVKNLANKVVQLKVTSSPPPSQSHADSKKINLKTKEQPKAPKSAAGGKPTPKPAPGGKPTKIKESKTAKSKPGK